MAHGTWMGPVGMALALLGGGALFAAQRRLARIYAALPPDQLAAADLSLGRLQYAIAVVVGAVVVYFEARSLGHGVEGLYACVALLYANAAVVAFLRVRFTRALGVGDEVVAQVARAAWAQALASWIGFAGCAIYLLRP